eukprot:GDKI01040175.1.p1 GENE.GDKI01040175.1~~GDKI01040175.1.p1  ORF type:complete len:658 (+),score=204.48 GDKI01040175.1:121-2094(+)
MQRLPADVAKAPLRVLILGAGERGKVYARYAFNFPERCKVVGVAEPNELKRTNMQKEHNIEQQFCFITWQAAFEYYHKMEEKCKKGAATDLGIDAVIICLLDDMHADSLTKFAALGNVTAEGEKEVKGVHILVEKPLATSLEDCRRCISAVVHPKRVEQKLVFGIGHVLRYTPYNVCLKKLLDERTIGDVISMQHTEPVGNWHFAHSFVRGNWRKEAESSFSLLTKSCHDIDLLLHYFCNYDNASATAKPSRVSSFGALSHFTRAHKPALAGKDTKRCVSCPLSGFENGNGSDGTAGDGKNLCPYSAKKVYVDHARAGHWGWPVAVVTGDVRDMETLMDKMENGPYGRCVYECDNDVCDNQTVNFEFIREVENAHTKEKNKQVCTAAFSMVAFSEAICQRFTKFYGTMGEIRGDSHSIEIFDFRTGKKTVMTPQDIEIKGMTGHGGGDGFLMQCFVDAAEKGDQALLHVTPQQVLDSHLCVFAGEDARKTGVVIDIKEYRKTHNCDIDYKLSTVSPFSNKKETQGDWQFVSVANGNGSVCVGEKMMTVKYVLPEGKIWSEVYINYFNELNKKWTDTKMQLEKSLGATGPTVYSATLPLSDTQFVIHNGTGVIDRPNGLALPGNVYRITTSDLPPASDVTVTLKNGQLGKAVTTGRIQ